MPSMDMSSFSPPNPNQGRTTGTRLRQNASSPYQGGLQTNFNNTSISHNGGFGGGGYTDYNNAGSDDPDVMEAQRLTNESADAGNVGVDHRANQALINKYKARIGLKNSLAERIAGQNQELGMAKDSVSSAANTALDQGTRNTRQNFNQRGLLYSGMREGGEQAVRGAVAGQYARGMAGAERDVANSTDSAKAAYAAVDLENQQETLKMANSAFDTAHANNIARLQAMQQLGQGVGQGVGQAAGSIAGSYYGGGNNNSNTLSKPQMGSQYGGYDPYNADRYSGLLSGGRTF